MIEAPPRKFSTRSRRFLRLSGNLGLAVLSLAAGLLACELLLRVVDVGYPIFVRTDPVRGVAHIPGAKSWRTRDGARRIEINSDGLRGPDIPLQRPAGTFRIALLGDSFIEGFQVPYDSTVGQVIARRLADLRGGPVEVLNFGVGGYGTAQELLTLRHEVWKYSPDLVLLGITTGNDISDNYRPLKRVRYVPYFVYRGDSLVEDTSFLASSAYRSRAEWSRRLVGLVQRSHVVQLVNRARHLRLKDRRQRANAPDITRAEPGLHNEVYLPPSTPDWQMAWRVTEGLLRTMRDECAARQTSFAVVTLTTGNQVTPVPSEREALLRQLGVRDLYYAERRLSDLGQREGIPVLNLAPAMAQEAEARHVYFHADGERVGVGHWNDAGHEAAGELIATWLGPRLAKGASPAHAVGALARPEGPRQPAALH